MRDSIRGVRRNAAVPQRFQLDLREQVADSTRTDRVSSSGRNLTRLCRHPAALAVSADGTILVAGDRAVVRLSPAGQVLGTIPLEQSPTCLAVAACGAG